MAASGHGYSRYVLSRMAEAQKGKADAYYDLGLVYATGQGVDRDLIEAHKWFNLAAARGLRRAIADREELARDMSPVEIAEAQRQARQWLQAH
ncbi:MAG: sel1 repeat family protein [Alphaproteobacteria bacterium]|nr:MAG: sel1 repeat family protein [Alphaproteobacteria bacterium]